MPVYLDLTADCETPLGAYSKIRAAGPAFLFESIVGGERISRYSFLGANPQKVFRVFEEEIRITDKDGHEETLPTPADPLKVIEAEMAKYQPVETPGMPPFTGGAVGY
ncbi:MAG TPA: anthranilate synthase component I, partial [Acidimicrobiia bacterium]